MKIKTDVHAGMSYAECDAQRDWWKQQAQMMESFAKSRSMTPPAGLWWPNQTTPPPTNSGGWVDGVWYQDMSGYCGGTTPPPQPPPNSGGWVNGVWYPDVSGSCG
jgi:hypothetical protein